MNKLIHVVRTTESAYAAPTRRGDILGFNPPHVSNAYDQFFSQGEFFSVREEEVDAIVEALANANPGRNINVYSLEQQATCPPAALVRKSVGKDGILPL